jgi:uncharacterized protein YegP (UPF0339 family)
MDTRRTWMLVVVVGFAIAALAGHQSVDAGDKGGKLKFEFFADKAKEYRWRLIGGDGKAMATSGQGYTTKQSCKDGIESVKKNGAGEKAKYEIYEDKGKEFRWRLLAPNGNNIASSSGSFKTKGDCESATAALKKGLAAAVVEELKELKE